MGKRSVSPRGRRSASPRGRPRALPRKAEKDPDGEKGLDGDYGNLLLLLLLYTLQGIPMGLSGAIPYILQDKNSSYTEQAVFSLVSWPFSLKLLWAPIVDSWYSESFGRRKTWLVPSQLAIGLTMLIGSASVDTMLADTPGTAGEKPDITALTVLFFWLFVLCATQDIAVDGWAITMLKPHNRSHASTTNAVGQSFGYFVAFTGFLALKTYDFCSLGQFMGFWAVVFLVTTVAVWLGKRETATPPEEQSESVLAVYVQMYQIVRLDVVRRLIVCLMTWKIGFAAADSITALKLMEYGVPKTHMATMATVLTPLSMVFPMVVASPWFERWTGMSTAGEQPLTLVAHTYSMRLWLGIGGAGLALVTQQIFLARPASADGSGAVEWELYAALLLFSALGSIISTVMFVGQMSFFARIADPAIGGTYMLNTITNLGSKWPSTLVLALVDPFTSRGCVTQPPAAATPSAKVAGILGPLEPAAWLHAPGPALGECHTNISESLPPYQAQLCLAAAPLDTEPSGSFSCTVLRDGYYPLCAICFVMGVLWLRVYRSTLLELEAYPITPGPSCPWHVRSKKSASAGSRTQADKAV
jgi:PAT family acetyl-CoA transporter-like MFS transporter 1